MRSRTFLAVLILAVGTQAALAQSAQCPTERNIVYIHKGVNDTPNDVMASVLRPNTVVLLDPDIDILFSNSTVKGEDGQIGTFRPGIPFIQFEHCVTLASYAPPATTLSLTQKGDGTLPVVPGSGRTPHSLGPKLRYDISGRADFVPFIEMRCAGDYEGDGARFLGIRVIGPDFNDHLGTERGINIRNCPDVEIANSEIAGWAEAAIHIDNGDIVQGIPTEKPSEILVRIHDNYIHHNQHSSADHHAAGYGRRRRRGCFREYLPECFRLQPTFHYRQRQLGRLRCSEQPHFEGWWLS